MIGKSPLGSPHPQCGDPVMAPKYGREIGIVSFGLADLLPQCGAETDADILETG